MDYISTTSLANDLDMPVNDLFTKLKDLGWINRKNDKWILTDLGKQKGGQTRNNPKFGEYIVWPEFISIDNHPKYQKAKLINATAIGKYFDLSSQRLNLIFSELGWIEKDIAGWGVTKLGKTLGGRQFEHETSGGTYVLWPDTILTNKNLTNIFYEPQGHQESQKSNYHDKETPKQLSEKNLVTALEINSRPLLEQKTDIWFVQELK